MRILARQRLRRDTIDASDTQNLFDDIGLALDIRPPGRHIDHDKIAVARQARGTKAEMLQNGGHFRRRKLDTGEAPHLAPWKRDAFHRAGNFAGEHDIRGFTAAELEYELRREFEARQGERRIDAALEAIACIGIDTKAAAGAGDVHPGPTKPIRSARRSSPSSSPKPRRP